MASGNDQRIELKIIHWIIYADRNKLHLKMLSSLCLKSFPFKIGQRNLHNSSSSSSSLIVIILIQWNVYCAHSTRCRRFNDDQMDESLVATPINRKLTDANGIRSQSRHLSLVWCCLSWSPLTCLCLTASLSSCNIAVVKFYTAHMQCHNLHHKCYSRKMRLSQSSTYILRFEMHVSMWWPINTAMMANGSIENQPFIMHVHDFKTI